MADKWFIGRNGERSGPFSPDQMRRMVAAGQLAATDLVWKEGMAAWVVASDVPGLIPASSRTYGSPPSTGGRAGGPDVGSPPMPAPARPGAGTYSFGAAFSLANQAFVKQWGGLALIGLVMFGAFFGLALPGTVLNAIGSASRSQEFAGFLTFVGQCFGQLLWVLVGGPFFAGVVLTGANALTGTPQVSDLFLGFKRYGTVLLASFLSYLCAIGVAIVACLPLLAFALVAGVVGAGSRQGAGMAAGIMLLGMLVTGVLMLAGFGLVGTRVFFASAIAADPELGSINAMDAIRRSWAATSPMTGLSLLGLFLLAGLLAGMSVLLLCVGYIVVGLPAMAVLMGAAYTLLFRSGDATASAV